MDRSRNKNLKEAGEMEKKVMKKLWIGDCIYIVRFEVGEDHYFLVHSEAEEYLTSSGYHPVKDEGDATLWENSTGAGGVLKERATLHFK